MADKIMDAINKLEVAMREGNKDARLDIKAVSDSVVELKVAYATTNEHLKNLNSKVVAQEARLQTCEKGIVDSKIKLGIIAGVGAVAGSGATATVIKLMGL